MKNLIQLFIIYYLLFIAVCFSQQSITWQRLYESPYHYWDYGQKICRTTDGNYVMVGYAWDLSNMAHIYAIKINQYGDTLWTKLFGQVMQGYAVTSTNDGGAVIVGYGQYSVKLDSSGETVWLKQYGSYLVQCYDIQKTSDGGYIACGIYYLQAYIMKIDSLGNLQWQKIYSSSNFIGYSSIKEALNGGYFVVGVISDCQQCINTPLLRRLSLQGDVIWEKRYTFQKGGGAITLVKSNSEYIIGGNMADSISLLSQNFFIRVDTSGNMVFRKLFPANQSQYFGDMAVINENQYVIAYVRDSTNYFYAINEAIIVDSMGNILHHNQFAAASVIDTKCVLPLNNGDILISGLLQKRQQLPVKSYYYVIRTDSTLSAPPIGITPIGKTIPVEFKLFQNYPNPFNPITEIKFAISKSSFVQLKIFDALGHEVIELVRTNCRPGIYSVKWNATGNATGVYFNSLFIDSKLSQTRKMVLLQ